MKATADWWNDCALWGQLNLQEHDPAHIDVQWWKDYWKRTHIDGVTLNASGIIHYYPTDQPGAWISPWLGGRDLFGELVTAARELGLYVLARFTPSRVHEELAQTHPDWCITAPDGQPRPDPGHDAGHSRRMYHMCMNGPYYRWWIPDVMFRELVERYGVDGFFFNAWQTPERTIRSGDIGPKGFLTIGPCHCRTCTERFRRETGHEIPDAPDWSDPVWSVWCEWHNDCMDDLGTQYQKAAKALKPSATVVLNLGGDLERMNDSGHWHAHAQTLDMVDHDHQYRRGPIWSMGMVGRLLRAHFHPKPYYHLFGVYGGLGRISAQPDAELALITAEMMASGSRMWYHVIGASGEDRRPFGAVERAFSFFHRNREYLLDAESMAEVAVVFSQRGADAYGKNEATRRCGEPLRGVAHALIRAGIPFDLLSVEDLPTEKTRRYRVLVLPNQACLSDEQCDAVRRFVSEGGGVVATFETSRYGESGALREDYALADLFGVEAAADRPHGPLNDAYLRLEEHDTLGVGLDGTDAVACTEGVSHCPVTVGADARIHLTLIPPIPRMPPERAYFHVRRTGTALGLSRRFGSGRVVYFPCDIDRTCAATNNPDHRRILENAVRWAANGPFGVEVAAPGLFDAHAYRQEGRVLVHLVNCTNPDNASPPATEIVAVGPVEIVLRTPSVVVGGRLLAADREIADGEIRRDGESTRITVPTVGAYEVVVCSVA